MNLVDDSGKRPAPVATGSPYNVEYPSRTSIRPKTIRQFLSRNHERCDSGFDPVNVDKPADNSWIHECSAILPIVSAPG